NSIEVEPEISRFEAERRLTPELGGTTRGLFYSFLESARGGGVQEIQGFPDLAPFYQPNAIDRGISNLDLGNGLAEWKRAVTMLGDAITNADKARPVVAAVVATTSSWLPLLDQIRGLAQSPSGPTLDEFLQPFGIQWSDVRGRYGQTALDWHP